MLRSGETAFACERSVQPLPKLGPWAADLDRLLEANGSKARRERLTMIRINPHIWLADTLLSTPVGFQASGAE